MKILLACLLIFSLLFSAEVSAESYVVFTSSNRPVCDCPCPCVERRPIYHRTCHHHVKRHRIHRACCRPCCRPCCYEPCCPEPCRPPSYYSISVMIPFRTASFSDMWLPPSESYANSRNTCEVDNSYYPAAPVCDDFCGEPVGAIYY